MIGPTARGFRVHCGHLSYPREGMFRLDILTDPTLLPRDLEALRAGRVRRVRLLRQPFPLRLGAAAAPAVYRARAADRVRAHRRRPHSTGVESASHTSSLHRLVSRASMPISQPTVPASARSRLL
jgi:hypothetical protein